MDDSNAHIGDNNKGSAGDRSQGHTDTLMQAPGDTIMHMLAAITQSTEAQNTVTTPSPAPTHTDTQSHTVTQSGEEPLQTHLPHRIHKRCCFIFEGLAEATGVPQLLPLVTLLPGTLGCRAVAELGPGGGVAGCPLQITPAAPLRCQNMTFGTAAGEPEVSCQEEPSSREGSFLQSGVPLTTSGLRGW